MRLRSRVISLESPSSQSSSQRRRQPDLRGEPRVGPSPAQALSQVSPLLNTIKTLNIKLYTENNIPIYQDNTASLHFH